MLRVHPDDINANQEQADDERALLECIDAEITAFQNDPENQKQVDLWTAEAELQEVAEKYGILECNGVVERVAQRLMERKMAGVPIPA